MMTATAFSYSTIWLLPTNLEPERPKYESKKNLIIDDVKISGCGHIKDHRPNCSIFGSIDTFNCDCDGHTEYFRNIALLTGLNSIINKLVDKDNTNTTDGFVTHFEVGMSNTAPNNTQTGTILPKDRKDVVQAFRDTTNAVFKTFFNGNHANTNQGEVLTGTSTTQFTLLSGQGSLFAEGQSIQVTISGTPSNTKIMTLVGDTVTVSPPLPSTPPATSPVEQLLTELVLYGGSNANDALGSGIAFARTTDFTPRTKASGFGMTVEWRITLT